jgi:hypothetical protein
MKEQATRLAAAVLDGEDPKAFLRRQKANKPTVVITTPQGQFTVPVYSTHQGQFTNLGYTAAHLTPEQRRMLDDYWEEIEFNAVEGDREGVIHGYGRGVARKAGTWQALGDWDNIPHGKMPPRDYIDVVGGGGGDDSRS